MPELIDPQQLSPDQYQPYFQPYLDKAGPGDVRDTLRDQQAYFQNLYKSVDEPTSQIVHAPYAWTIRQVVGHMIDTEKIFGCRAHRIACQENQPLPGFDQDIFVDNTDYSNVTLSKLVEEFILLRQSNCLSFARYNETMWNQSGLCDGKKISVKAIACVMAGHVVHHCSIVEKRLAS